MQPDQSTSNVAQADCPSVLILLATYNGGDFIEQQILSLASQEGVRVTVAISDDCSTDNTLALAVRSLEISQLEYFRLENKMPSGSAAGNFFRLMKYCRYQEFDYVALCDQDDIWMPRKLAEAIQLMEQGRADCYSSNSSPFWPNGRTSHINKAHPMRKFDYLFESASHGCTYVYSSKVAKDFSLFLVALGDSIQDFSFHDWLMYAWARSIGLNWIMDSRSFILYRQSGKNVIGANVGLVGYLTRIRMLRSGWLRGQALLLAEVLGLSAAKISQHLARWNFVDKLHLCILARSCRRRFRDQLVFAIMVITVGI